MPSHSSISAFTCLTVSLEEFQNLVDGAKYGDLHIVAILGPQSSGKSTLLNGLFQTGFKVMDETIRRQTTRGILPTFVLIYVGIWACRNSANDTLVLDVEGTDGRERGEDQVQLQWKTKLLIVNIWENSVGLYHAANMNLLRTVMDVHFQLADPSRSSRTVLLFVIRDYVGKTPKENLSNVIREDLRTIWASLKAQRVDADLEDSFNLQFAFLPHKILQPNEFNEEVACLRRAFKDAHFEDYIFPKTSASAVESHDLPLFAKNIWEKIESSKDLDLPTERELLAQFRCDEVLNTNFLELFAAETGRYSKNISLRKSEELEERLAQTCQDLITKQMEISIKEILCDFDLVIEEREPGESFKSALVVAREVSKKKFTDTLHGTNYPTWLFLLDTVPSCLELNVTFYNENFSTELEFRCEAIKLNEATSIVQRCQKKIETLLQEVRGVSFGMGAAENFWKQFWELMAKIDAFSKNALQVIESGIPLGGRLMFRSIHVIAQVHQAPTWTGKLGDRGCGCITQRRIHRSEDCGSHSCKVIGGLHIDFKTSREAAMEEIDSLQSSAIPAWVDDSVLNGVFGSNEVLHLVDLIIAQISLMNKSSSTHVPTAVDKQLQRRYIDAKRSALSTNTHIPPWVFLLLLVLGWNEIMSILTSPLYFLLFLVICAVFVTVRTFNLTPYIGMGLDYMMRIARQKTLEFQPKAAHQSGTRSHTKED
ncbi:Protein SEY1 [Paramicrosporidium saccamoebae]|uniref:Protein SEY1 n=1 Tax=Paramicrosporidium saccamoebae TaxID=1246581 RepID=A0A2H9TR05_9FUNG|nr:Protein SEY1 [Paramicrosporidium saccamoebae]